MSKKWHRAFRSVVTFQEWLGRLKRFNYALIRENRLQTWTMADFKAYWTQAGRAL